MRANQRLRSQPNADLSMLSQVDRYNVQAKVLAKTAQNRGLEQARRDLFKRPARLTPLVTNKTLPYLDFTPNNDEEVSLVKMRAERHSEEDSFSMLKSKIFHFEHEKEHCEQVVGRARRKYNSIIEVRTQALEHRQQLEKV